MASKKRPVGNQIDQQVAVVAEETDTAKALIRALGDVILPMLTEQTLKIREARAAAVAEVAQTIEALHNFRRFFGQDIEQELVRAERFLAVCRELQALAREGVIDDVAGLVRDRRRRRPPTPGANPPRP